MRKDYDELDGGRRDQTGRQEVRIQLNSGPLSQ